MDFVGRMFGKFAGKEGACPRPAREVESRFTAHPCGKALPYRKCY